MVDYTYDTQNFFNTTEKQNALQAAADRYSRIISSSLTAVAPGGNGTTPAGWRIGFNHPGTGAPFEISTAADSASDPLGFASDADVYGFPGLSADTWILYAGGRSLGAAGEGGSGTGSNYFSTADDLNGPLHRGVISNNPAGGSGDTFNDIPAWGGAITFDNDGGTDWHFDHTAAAPTGKTDFYSVALHEIGHALGLNVGFNQWSASTSANSFSGANALAAYNSDNGASLTSLNLVSGSNFHWAEDVYDSVIFPEGDPNLVGTVGTGVLQDALMEPTGDFTPSIRRLELTNMDVAALEDLGWSVVPEPSTGLLLTLASFVLFGIRRRKED